MATGKDFITLARKHIGEQYVFGANVPKDDADWSGPWDCAEFVSWVAFQVTGELYGCDNNSGNPAKANAYTGNWERDAKNGSVSKISVADASDTVGAILLRYPSAGTGHIVFVAGPNQTVEAHSTKEGVIQSVIQGRRWDCGVLIPGVDYGGSIPSDPGLPDDDNSSGATVYRLKTPHMKGDVVRRIQQALADQGFDVGTVDGDFGQKTADAVAQFQISQGVVADGEVGQETAKLLGISLD